MKVYLQCGETCCISLTLNADAFFYYGLAQPGWVMKTGGFEVVVGGLAVEG